MEALGRDQFRKMWQQSYSERYKSMAALMSAIKRKGHFDLFTQDSEQKPILKVYVDKDLATEVAMFKPDKPVETHTKKGGQPEPSWVLVRQAKLKVTRSYEQEETTQ